MTPDDINPGLRMMQRAFMEFHQFRCEQARHVDGGTFNSYEAAGRFWQGFHAVRAAMEAYEAETDEINDALYEEALVNGEPWAIEAYDHRNIPPE